MTISQRLPRSIIAAVILVMLALFALVQLASMSFVHEPGTLSAAIPVSFGRAVYDMLDRAAPAAYVDETLAQDALARGDLDSAQRYAQRLGAGARRDELLGRIAQARGDAALARTYYFNAPDVDRMQAAIAELAKTDAPGAYALEVRFAQRLAELQRHPDALAQAYFKAGNYAEWLRRRKESADWYRRTVALAPLDLNYTINAGSEAYVSGDYPTATHYYQRGLEINPACGDCFAGLGMVAVKQGNRAQAQAYAARARAADPKSKMLEALNAALR